MNYFTKAMVGITGHYVGHMTNPEDVGGLSKIGLSICFASLLAALQFGIAGWFLSENLGLFAQTLISITTSIVGAPILEQRSGRRLLKNPLVPASSPGGPSRNKNPS